MAVNIKTIFKFTITTTNVIEEGEMSMTNDYNIRLLKIMKRQTNQES